MSWDWIGREWRSVAPVGAVVGVAEFAAVAAAEEPVGRRVVVLVGVIWKMVVRLAVG